MTEDKTPFTWADLEKEISKLSEEEKGREVRAWHETEGYDIGALHNDSSPHYSDLDEGGLITEAEYNKLDIDETDGYALTHKKGVTALIINF